MTETIATIWDAKPLQQLMNAGQFNDEALKVWREQALQDFLAQGFPTRKNEAWKYTPLQSLQAQTFAYQANSAADVDLANYQLENTNTLVFINGHYQQQLSVLNAVPDGVVISNALSANHQSTYAEYFKSNSSQLTAFAQLNAALLTDGLFLFVPAGVVIEQPIHLLYVNTKNDMAYMQHPRHTIVVQANSQVTVFEEYVGLDQATYFNNVVTNIHAAAGACVNYYKCQRESKAAYHIANTWVHQQQDSQVNTYHFAIGAKLAREDLHFDFAASGCDANLIGFYHGGPQQHTDYHTRIDHQHPHCQSQQDYRGIVHANAHSVFNGKVVVHPHAQQTKALQSNKNLLLAPSAEVDTKPELEIYADDVQCSHGATVGQLDETALFYLQSRGINKNQAIELLTYAFVNELLQALPHKAIATRIQHLVTEHIQQSEEC